MRFNKYIAVGFANGSIVVTDPRRSLKDAVSDFYNNHRHTFSCNVRRVMVRTSGEIVHDPDFKMKRVSKISA